MNHPRWLEIMNDVQELAEDAGEAETAMDVHALADLAQGMAGLLSEVAGEMTKESSS